MKMRNCNRAYTLLAAAAAVGFAGTSTTAFADGPPSGRKTIVVKASEMPAPYATPSANNAPKIVPKPDDVSLVLPPGFKAEVFAEGFNNPRTLTVAPNGDVFVVESGPNRVTCLRDTTGAGKADVREVFADNLTQPFGIAFWKEYLYIGNTGSVVRFSYKAGQTKATAVPETVVPD